MAASNVSQSVPDRHIRRSGGDYATQFLTLLPQGQAWPREPGSTLVGACNGLADYWGFVDGRAADLLEIESDPRATLELLRDWEIAFGLPDPCLIDPPTSLVERRNALILQMTLLGGQSRAFFYGVADKLGYQISIQEFAPYMTGVSLCGDTRGYDPIAPNYYHWELGPPENRFYWTVHVNGRHFTYFRCNSSQCGIDRLLKIGLYDDLECMFNRWKPAHTKIVFDYSPFDLLDFSQVHNTEYLALGIL
jgi:uncharacterized protein YmfQ (DUF2313 family)